MFKVRGYLKPGLQGVDNNLKARLGALWIRTQAAIYGLRLPIANMVHGRLL